MLTKIKYGETFYSAKTLLCFCSKKRNFAKIRLRFKESFFMAFTTGISLEFPCDSPRNFFGEGIIEILKILVNFEELY